MNNALTHQAAIIGAGPYGLAASAHLRAQGVETCIFGEAMAFWDKQMPAGMLVRSIWEACHIADPDRALTLDRFQATQTLPLPQPLPLEKFVQYGRWFQKQAAPDLDPRRVVQIRRTAKGFAVNLEDGDMVHVARVVVAAGIARFPRRPAVFEGLPPHLATHSSAHRDLKPFCGRRVTVIGGGQSALESAALLHENGARVEVIARQPAIHWLDQKATWLKSERNPFRRIFYPPSDVGPPGLNWIVATPALFRRLPMGLQESIAHRSIRPAGSGWLKPRLSQVPITTGCSVVSATPFQGALQLRLDDGTTRETDHAFLCTGFRVDVARYGFLGADLMGDLRVVNGYPVLGPALESSVPGLHFLGAPAARSFGPVCRFVAGTQFAGRELGRAFQGRKAGQPLVQADGSALPVLGENSNETTPQST